MKKLILGVAIMALGGLGAISLISAAVLSPLNPWDYNGIGGWLGCFLGMGLTLPFCVCLALFAAGMILALWGVFEKQ